MDIKNTRLVKEAAGRRLRDAGQAQRIVMVYAGVVLGMSVLMTLLGVVLDMLMANAAGLSGMGKRTILSSLQSMLPWVSALITMCIELGYQSSMLRVARGQYASLQSLQLGFERFWLLLRCTVLKGLMLVSIYAASFLFLMLPLSRNVTELLAPVMSSTTLLSPDIALDEAMSGQLLQAMIPAFILCGIFMAILMIPLLYRFRMIPYIIIDKPGISALGALKESTKMMKGSYLKLLRLDVSLWPYYAASVGTMLLCYGDMLLALAGVQLPMGETMAYYLFFALYIAAEFAVYYFLRNPVETAYAIAYDSLRPKESNPDGAVLGSIFNN